MRRSRPTRRASTWRPPRGLTAITALLLGLGACSPGDAPPAAGPADEGADQRQAVELLVFGGTLVTMNAATTAAVPTSALQRRDRCFRCRITVIPASRGGVGMPVSHDSRRHRARAKKSRRALRPAGQPQA